jgi:predicted signal transduction protein with EAL and GGDEF domain
MGASWLEVDKLIRELDTLTEFPHADALPSVVRARDVVAETAMVVSLAGLSEDPGAERDAHDLLARARVAMLEAQNAVRRASETVAISREGRARAKQLIEEARALRARDRSRATLTAARATISQPGVALMRRAEPAAS